MHRHPHRDRERQGVAKIDAADNGMASERAPVVTGIREGIEHTSGWPPTRASYGGSGCGASCC